MVGYLTTVSGPGCTQQMCVILTRAAISLQVGAGIAPLSYGRENQRRQACGARRMSIGMTKETKPLWVWLSLALLAIGSLAYVTTVFLFEYVIGLF